MVVKFEKEPTDGVGSGSVLDSLNTTGGHIFVCLIISVFGAVLMWMGRAEPAIFAIGIGLLQTGIGVIFRSMGMPNPIATAPQVVRRPISMPAVAAPEPEPLTNAQLEAMIRELSAKIEADTKAPQRS